MLSDWMLRLRALFKRTTVEKEIDDELRFHVDRQVESYIAEGLTPAEATRRARLAFGQLDHIKEEYRDALGTRLLDDLKQDVGYGARALLRAPGFTCIALLTVGIGIGASSAIFSVLNAVLIRDLPYGDVQQLVYVGVRNPKLADIPIDAQGGIGAFAPSNADFDDLRRAATSFSALTIFAQDALTLIGRDATERIGGARVSGDFFRTLDVQPELGRVLGPDDDGPGRPRVAVISHRLWQTAFGGAPDILTRQLRLGGGVYEVVGVMPPQFLYPRASDVGPDAVSNVTDVWIPMALTARQRAERDFSNNTGAIGRLKPGVSLGDAQAESSVLIARIDERHSRDWRGWHAVVTPLADSAVRDVRRPLWFLFGAVLLVLLIACGNAAHLTLARAEGRHHEIAVRAALGAGRGRLIRQLLTEAMLLAVAGGALGIAVSYAAVLLLPHIDPGNIPRLEETSVDWRVLSFGAGLSILTGMTFGLFPALTVSRTEIGDVMKRAGSARTTGSSRMRGALVVLQVSLAVLLVAGATILLESYRNVQMADRGFSSSTLTLRISLDARYREAERRRAFFRQLLGDVRALPDVDAAGGVNALPLSGSEAISFFTLDGFANKDDQMVNTRWVSAGYFDAMGTRVEEGRAIEDSDVEGQPPVVVVNEAFASRYYPGVSAVGKRFRIRGLDASSPPRPWSMIVGVVANVRHSNLEDAPPPQVYSSVYQGEPMDSLYVAVRTRVAPDAMVSTLRRTIRNIDPQLPMADIHVMGELVSEAGARRRFQTTLLTAFGVVALALAAIGLYGLMSYMVRQRTKEIGVRLALGARTSDVLLLVASYGAKVTLLGVSIGAVAALVLARVLVSMLYGVTPSDPRTLVVTALVQMGAAIVACYVPARRAMRVDPVNTLRAD
jgi:putative ABC transport system permease protein